MNVNRRFMATTAEKGCLLSALLIATILLSTSVGLFIPTRALADSLSIDQVNIEAFPHVKVFLQVESNEKEFEKRVGDRAEKGTDLTRTIRVLEDSTEREIIEIRHLTASVPASAVVMLLDISGSLRGEPFREMKKAVLTFISAMKTGEEVAIVTFGDDVTIDLGFTDDRDALRKTLDTLKISGKITVLHDAISQAVDLFASRRFQGRKAIVVFSDGKDEGSRIDYSGLLKKITRSNIPIFSIGFSKVEKRWLQHMASFAESTNGRYLYVPKAENLSEIFESVRTRIRDTYVLVYASRANREDAHELRIQWEDSTALKRFHLPDGFFREQAKPLNTPIFVPEPDETGSPVLIFPLREVALFGILLSLVMFYTRFKIRQFKNPPKRLLIRRKQGRLRKIAASAEKEIKRLESNKPRGLDPPVRRLTASQSNIHMMEKLFLKTLGESKGDEIGSMKIELNEEEVFFAAPTCIRMLKNAKGRESEVIGNVLRKIASVSPNSGGSHDTGLSDTMNDLEYWENWWEKARTEKTAKLMEENLHAEAKRKREADERKLREALEKRKERIQEILAKQSFSNGTEIPFLGIDPYRNDSMVKFSARIEKHEAGKLFLSCKKVLDLETLIAPSDKILHITPFWENIRMETIIQADVFYRVIAIEEKEAGAYSVVSGVLKSFEEEITIDQLFERVKAA